MPASGRSPRATPRRHPRDASRTCSPETGSVERDGGVGGASGERAVTREGRMRGGRGSAPAMEETDAPEQTSGRLHDAPRAPSLKGAPRVRAMTPLSRSGCRGRDENKFFADCTPWPDVPSQRRAARGGGRTNRGGKKSSAFEGGGPPGGAPFTRIRARRRRTNARRPPKTLGRVASAADGAAPSRERERRRREEIAVAGEPSAGGVAGRLSRWVTSARARWAPSWVRVRRR